MRSSLRAATASPRIIFYFVLGLLVCLTPATMAQNTACEWCKEQFVNLNSVVASSLGSVASTSPTPPVVEKLRKICALKTPIGGSYPDQVLEEIQGIQEHIKQTILSQFDGGGVTDEDRDEFVKWLQVESPNNVCGMTGATNGGCSCPMRNTLPKVIARAVGGLETEAPKVAIRFVRSKVRVAKARTRSKRARALEKLRARVLGCGGSVQTSPVAEPRLPTSPDAEPFIDKSSNLLFPRSVVKEGLAPNQKIASEVGLSSRGSGTSSEQLRIIGGEIVKVDPRVKFQKIINVVLAANRLRKLASPSSSQAKFESDAAVMSDITACAARSTVAYFQYKNAIEFTVAQEKAKANGNTFETNNRELKSYQAKYMRNEADSEAKFAQALAEELLGPYRPRYWEMDDKSSGLADLEVSEVAENILKAEVKYGAASIFTAGAIAALKESPPPAEAGMGSISTNLDAQIGQPETQFSSTIAFRGDKRPPDEIFSAGFQPMMLSQKILCPKDVDCLPKSLQCFDPIRNKLRKLDGNIFTHETFLEANYHRVYMNSCWFVSTSWNPLLAAFWASLPDDGALTGGTGYVYMVVAREGLHGFVEDGQEEIFATGGVAPQDVLAARMYACTSHTGSEDDGERKQLTISMIIPDCATKNEETHLCWHPFPQNRWTILGVLFFLQLKNWELSGV